MDKEFYSVKIDDTVIAKEMSLEIALFQEWYRESDLSITVVKEDRMECCNTEN